MTEPRVAGRPEPQPELSVKPLDQAPTSKPLMQYESIPIDVFRYFDLSITDLNERTKNELQDISAWAYGDVESSGDGLMKLRRLEMRLGMPTTDERRHSKIWNWIRIENAISDMRKRQEALSG